MSQSLSYSRARNFEECAAKFKAQYIDGLAEPGEPPLVIGSLVHECCDRYVKHLVAEQSPCDFAAMDRIFREVWSDPKREHLAESYKDEVYGLCVKARELLKFDSPHHIAGAEIKVAVDRDWKPVPYDSPRAFVRGKIDRLDLDDEMNAHVVDYKSGWRLDAIDKAPQLPLYAALVKAYQPAIRSIKISLIYLRHDKVKSRVIEERDYATAKEWIVAIGDRMERAAKENSYPARPGQACRSCPAFGDCEARKTSIKPIPPGDESAAIRIVERIVLLDRERKDLLDAAASWVDQYGDIEANGVVLGYSVVNKFKFDVKQAAQVLTASGYNPLDYLTINTTAIKKIGRRDQKTAADLLAGAEDRSTTALKLHLGGESDDDAK